MTTSPSSDLTVRFDGFPVPGTGEVVDLNDAKAVAWALNDLRNLRGLLDEARRVLEDALVQESARVGTKTLRFGEVEAVITGGDKIEWDADELAKLLDAGLPQERFLDLISTEISYKVDAGVAKQLAAANPEYATIIERAKQRVPAPTYVRVKRR